MILDGISCYFSANSNVSVSTVIVAVLFLVWIFYFRKLLDDPALSKGWTIVVYGIVVLTVVRNILYFANIFGDDFGMCMLVR